MKSLLFKLALYLLLMSLLMLLSSCWPWQGREEGAFLNVVTPFLVSLIYLKWMMPLVDNVQRFLAVLLVVFVTAGCLLPTLHLFFSTKGTLRYDGAVSAGIFISSPVFFLSWLIRPVSSRTRL